MIEGLNIEGLKSTVEGLSARIKDDQDTRKTLNKLIRKLKGEAAPQGEPERIPEKNEEPERVPEPAKPKATKKPQNPFDIPFKDHRFIYFAEAYKDDNGKEYPERGWLAVAEGMEAKMYKDCLIKVSDMEDLPLAKDGYSVFKVVDDCSENAKAVKVVVHT